MALNATLHRISVNVADLDRHYYADHGLTLARHPSETEERMMVRLLAFALHASERLEVGRGIGVTDEPEIGTRDLTGRIELWIDVGLPDERRLRKACGLAERVILYAYGGRNVDLWFAKAEAELSRFRNLEVIALATETTQALAALAGRSMELQLMVQDGEAWLTRGETRVPIQRRWLKGGSPA